MIRHIHSSGRYDRSDAVVRKAVLSYAKYANVITLTEQHSRPESVFEMPGWTVVKYKGHGPGDPVIIVKDSDYEVVKSWSSRLTKHQQRRDGKGPDSPHATTALIRATGNSSKKVLVTVAHLPSHVQQNWRANFYWRVFVWRDCVKHWKKDVNTKRRVHSAKVMYIADWNLDFKKAPYRGVLKFYFPALKLAWHRFPNDGTHHRRVIDATVTNLRAAKHARLWPDDASSDHRPYYEELK